jgi:hypothetical protein
MKICNLCNESFENHSLYANHIRWKHTKDTTKNFSKGAIQGKTKQYGDWKFDKIKCFKSDCNSEVEIKYREKKGPKEKNYCSLSCANSRGPRNEDFHNKVSTSIKLHWENGTYKNLDQSNNIKFSSKQERLIVEHFKTKFPLDEWKSGGNIKCGDYRVSRDLWSDKLKICFEFDGIWHFKDINNQLELKQKKDSALESWCILNDYRLIRLQDGFYDNIERIFFELEVIIYKTNTKIVKLGESY